MKNNQYIYSFLKSTGFELIKKDTSTFFGNYYDIFTNDSFQLRFSSSKSFETVDIRSDLPNENWYDLALVRALLQKIRQKPRNRGFVTGYNVGYPIFKQRQFERRWKKATNPWPTGPKW